MLSVSTAQLDAWMAAFIYPLARILALVASAPIFNNQANPTRSRLGLGVVLAIAIAPALPPMPPLAPGSGLGLVVLAQQILIGVAMGLALRLAFSAVDVAGELIGLQMGLSFAVFYDPQNAGQSSTLAEFLGLLATLIFLAMDGHLMVLSVLVESFRLLPVGTTALAANGLRDIVAWAAIVFSAGVLLALPLIAALLVTNIALGVITRAAPQLNLFAVGFPVTIVVGFAALLLTLPQAAPVLGKLFQQGIDAMGLALQAAR